MIYDLPGLSQPRVQGLEVHVDELEAELLEKARRGDPSAAPFLVSCYGERLLGYARAHAPDLSDADRERIVEMAIEAGVRAIDRFEPEKGTLRSWFRTQIRYQTLAWRRATPPRTAIDGEPVEACVETPTLSDTTDALRRAIARLSRDDQIVLALRSGERLDYFEIAQRLGISESAARQRQSRALKRLGTEARSENELRHLASETDR